MINDVWVFGDSHWRVFFPFVNHGAATDNAAHTENDIMTIDTIANELSGSTMWGLLNNKSKHGARNRILETLNALGGTAENVGLVFGEVDARYHYDRYFAGDRFVLANLLELLARYTRFIHEDLLASGLVKKNVFVYHGFWYPKRGETLQQPGQPIGDAGFAKADAVNGWINELLPTVLQHKQVHTIRPSLSHAVSDDGVHLIPEKVYPHVLAAMSRVLNPSSREISF